uniref:Uncharacterized protein n=1 Tax=viral metagenome TaxID=1070528 RepID=A0A6C0JC20_9ZZZZ
MEYTYIVNPKTNRKCLITSRLGKQILNDYIQAGGLFRKKSDEYCEKKINKNVDDVNYKPKLFNRHSCNSYCKSRYPDYNIYTQAIDPQSKPFQNCHEMIMAKREQKIEQQKENKCISDGFQPKEELVTLSNGSLKKVKVTACKLKKRQENIQKNKLELDNTKREICKKIKKEFDYFVEWRSPYHKLPKSKQNQQTVEEIFTNFINLMNNPDMGKLSPDEIRVCADIERYVN